jgi:hypothetical protein
MCFSAMASFGASGVLAAAGGVALIKVNKARQIPLASVPLVFAAQQAVEGFLWLTVPAGHAAGRVPASLFAGVALVLWPLLMPIAVGLAEAKPGRRPLLFAFIIPGLAVALYSLADILSHPYLAWPAPHSLVYINDHLYPWPLIAAYFLSVCAPPLLASDPFLKLFGLIVTAGLGAALAFFFVNLVSVWCFFAAIASALLAVYFWRINSGPRLSHSRY